MQQTNVSLLQHGEAVPGIGLTAEIAVTIFKQKDDDSKRGTLSGMVRVTVRMRAPLMTAACSLHVLAFASKLCKCHTELVAVRAEAVERDGEHGEH